MKNKTIVIIFTVLAVAAIWIMVLSSNASTSDRANELKRQIEENVEVKTYKNTIPLYNELISMEPEEIKWYIGLADAYRETNQYGNYQSCLNKIISLFPNEKIGYLRKLQLLEELGKSRDVLSFYRDDIPELFQNEEDFLAIYRNCEWSYQFLSSTYDDVGSFVGPYCVVKKDGKYGYRSIDGSNDVECQFDMAQPFIEDLAAVCKGHEWFFVDHEGDRVLAFKDNDNVEELFSFSEGYAAARINGRYGFVDRSLNQYCFEYDYVTTMYNGVAAVKKGNKWALVNSAFQAITEFVFDDVIRDDANICTKRGMIFAQKDGSYHLLDLTGLEIGSESYEDARVFYSDYAAVKKGGKWGFIDTSGKACSEFIYDDASSFAAGIGAVYQYDRWGCVDLDGNSILEFDYLDASVTTDKGIVAVKIGNVYRFIKFYKYG